MVEIPRLSIANRFMSGEYNKNEAASSSGSISVSALHNKLSPASSILSTGYVGETAGDSMPGRLTIAEAFMKSSSTLPNTIRSCSVSLMDEQVRSDRKESRNSRSSIFDDTFQLGLATSNDQGRKNSRPWGSQDTLVQMDKKKPIYAQFIESEKYATLNRDYSEDDKTAHSDYEDNRENAQLYDKFENYYQNGPTGWEPTEEENSNSESEEKEQTIEKAPSIKTFEQMPEMEESKGIWIGCCFISCNRRSLPKKKEEDIEQQADTKHSKCCGRRLWVFCSFILIIVCALVAYFLWPRIPLMRIEGASLTSPVKITETKQNMWFGGSIQFESEWLVNVTVDNRKNHIPTHLSQIQVLAKDALTGLVIGKGTQNDDPSPEQVVLPPNSISTIQLPIRIDYQARDNTDTTFGDLLKSCSPKQSSPSTNSTNLNQREALALHFWITLHFFGLDWTGYKPTVIAAPATGGFACPQS
ncbi:hypothetical protein EDC96DRAFT_436071 [Choanephora cucurbitarum]|nr:hypothetical protein EDC96DRAFT_436071 [Choanephora cucurbitarum]